MFRGKQIINKPIVTSDTGERIYDADNLVFDPTSGEILAIIAEEGSLFSRTKIVPFSQIVAIGPDAITVKSRDSIVTAEEDNRVKRVIQDETEIRGKKVLTKDGRNLGFIEDIVFDERNGQIEGYEVTGGLFADAYKGRPFLPSPKIDKVGKDVVFVPNETAEMMEKQTGGLKGMAQEASKRIEQTTKETGKKIERGAQEVTERAQTVTSEVEEKTSAYSQRARRFAQDYTSKEKTKDLRQSAADFWDEVKRRFSDTTGRAAENIQKEKIKEALGRPVSRVIYDQEDNVILDVGDLVTHKAIYRARESGVLDVLLSSITKKQPYIPQSEFRATKDERDEQDYRDERRRRR